MKAKTLLEYLLYIKKVAPEDLELDLTFETPESWMHWAMINGVSKRSQHGKPSTINVRL